MRSLDAPLRLDISESFLSSALAPKDKSWKWTDDTKKNIYSFIDLSILPSKTVLLLHWSKITESITGYLDHLMIASFYIDVRIYLIGFSLNGCQEKVLLYLETFVVVSCTDFSNMKISLICFATNIVHHILELLFGNEVHEIVFVFFSEPSE